MAHAGLRQLARDDLVVERHGDAWGAPDQRHEAIRLRPPEDVVGQENVVGDPRVDEDLDLAELLAGDPHRPRRHLHLPDRGDLVGLDVGPVADAVAREVRLHPLDIVLHDVHVNGDGGRLEIAGERHGRLLCRVRVDDDIAQHSVITRARSR